MTPQGLSQLIYVIYDIFATILLWLFSFLIIDHFILITFHDSFLYHLHLHTSFLVIVVPIVIGTHALFGLYTLDRIYSYRLMGADVVKSAMISSILVLLITFLNQALDISQSILAPYLILSPFILLVSRLIARKHLSLVKKSKKAKEKIAIIGSGILACNVYHELNRLPFSNIKLLGFIHDAQHSPAYNLAPHLGLISQIHDIIAQLDIDTVFIALSIEESERTRELFFLLREQVVDVHMVPDVFDFYLINHSVANLGQLPVVNLSRKPIYGLNAVFKRIEDIVISAIALVLFFPLFMLIAMMIKLSSPGPILFMQERVGANGKPFMMLKFRTMHQPMEPAPSTIDQEKALSESDVRQKVFTQKDDVRITPIGKILRRTSLDELPQFFNVLKGDMSVVGPRPEQTWIVDKIKREIPMYMIKHKVKAGITGWAQIHGFRGSSTSLKRRIEFDLYYINHWSIWLDIFIVWKTIWKGLVHPNAY